MKRVDLSADAVPECAFCDWKGDNFEQLVEHLRTHAGSYRGNSLYFARLGRSARCICGRWLSLLPSTRPDWPHEMARHLMRAGGLHAHILATQLRIKGARG